MQPSDILVTGGGAGIGRGIATNLATFGADIAIADIDPERAAQTAELVEKAGRRALAITTDVSDTDAVRAMVEEVDRAFGRVDILVNNAGGVRRAAFLEQSERSWRRHIDLNLVSVIAATSAVAPIMIRGGRGGSIVNVASIEALRAAPMYAVYSACKAGMSNFTRTMAVELSEHGIRVNCLAPDIIATPGIRGLMHGPVPEPLPPAPESFSAGMATYVPLGGEGSTEDTGAAAVFLCSRMGRYISGITLSVDGGTWASGGWTRAPGDEGWRLHG
jgi:NAD(P)-dependent dehydrogenase (short-subunit alcohol dehydrogenase family)